MAIKTKKTPSSAKVTYSTTDAAVASVYDGTITANGVGTATITAKMVYGSKTIKKTIKITVVAGLEDGITATLTNPVSAEYPNATLLSSTTNRGYATYQIYYGKNGKGVADVTLRIDTVLDTASGKIPDSDSVVTDANGLATFSISNNGLGVSSADFTITAIAAGEKTTGSVAFAKITTDDIQNVNGKTNLRGTDYVKAGYKGLSVSLNDKNGTNGDGLTETNATFTTHGVDAADTSSREAYKVEYVDSQQVSTTDEHQVGFIGGLPYITLPGKSSDLNAATTFEQNVGLTSDAYDTYASNSQYIELSVDPSELTYATLNFSSLKLSAYSRLEIETYTSKAAAEKSDAAAKVGTTTTVTGPHDQANFSYQIPLTTKGNGLCVKVTLKSAGQVNTDMNKGYTITNITGVYKNKSASADQTTVPLKGAEIKWSTTEAKYSEERELTSAVAATLQKASNVTLTGGNIAKTTYRVPVFPYTGNAVITTYDKNNKVIAYYACPTVNKKVSGSVNTNVLDTAAEYVYQISVEEAFNSVGEITSQTNDLVTVNSKLAGTTNLVGTITGVEGLDATNSTVYTSIQWNPVNATQDAAAHSGAIAFSGQNVEVVAQLTDLNGNAVSAYGQNITFSVGNNKEVNASTITDASAVQNGTTVAVVKHDSSTDTKGQAKLILNAATETTLVGLTASISNKSYKVVLKLADQTVEAADIYWIEAASQFTPDVNAAPITGAAVNVAAPIVGENWEYGFEMQKVTLKKGVFDANVVTINDANIGIAVVRNADNTANVATVNTNTGVNGMATATSKRSGKTTFETTVDGSAIAGKTVKFAVAKADGTAVGTYETVGSGKTSFVNKQTLEVVWATSGMTASFDSANGMTASTGAAFDLYLKVADNLGNGVTGAAPVVTSDKNSTVTVTPVANVDGLYKLTVPATGKTDGEREIITATVDNVAYTTVITWKAATTPAVNITDKDADGHFLTNWSGDTITLTFNKDILASSVDASQFTVTYGSGTDVYAVESATVNGNVITLKVKNGPTSTSIDKTYTVNIRAIKKNGVQISAKTVEGAELQASVNTTPSVLQAGIVNIAQ